MCFSNLVLDILDDLVLALVWSGLVGLKCLVWNGWFGMLGMDWLVWYAWYGMVGLEWLWYERRKGQIVPLPH